MFVQFASSVRSIVGPVLELAGFEHLSDTETRVRFGRGDVVAEVAYYTEDRPNPWIAFEVGLVDGGGCRTFGIWRALPVGSAAADYPNWRFSDDASLSAALVRVRDALVAPYGAELWDDRGRIEQILAEQSNEIDQRYLLDQQDADLRRARRAFDDERFQDSIDAYVQLEPTALSARDRRLLHLARKRLMP